jgi:hypothetical protein
VIRRPVVALAVALTAGVVVALLVRAPSPAEPNAGALPTEAEGRAALERALEGAQRLGTRFCRTTASRADCASAWEEAGGAGAVPRSEPRVTGVRAQGERRVLELCGTNGRGEPYRSDFAVTRVGGSVVPVNPVFWFDVRVVESGVDQMAAARPPGSAPEACDA